MEDESDKIGTVVREGFLDSEGHRLAYLAFNEHLNDPSKPALVFIHGVLGSVNFWRGCLPAELVEGRAWYSLSLPAHFPSAVPDNFSSHAVNDDWFCRVMSGAIRQLAVDRPFVVIGHSTGGFCAINLAAHQTPNLVGFVGVAGFHRGRWNGAEGLLLKLASMGGAGKNSQLESENWLAKLGSGLFVSNIRAAQSSRTVRRIFFSLLTRHRRRTLASRQAETLLGAMEADVLAHNPAALATLFRGIASLSIENQLANIQVPGFLFVGSHDPVVNDDQSTALARGIPNVKTVRFENAGHMPMTEQAEDFSKALLQAIASLSGEVEPTENKRAKDMSYPQYAKDLQNIHESEVYGRAVFEMAAKVTRSTEQRDKWLILRALEEQTLERYLSHMAETGQRVVEPRLHALKGKAEGAALGLMPWKLAMKLVKDATGPFQERFLRLKKHASEKDREFFAYVYAHEKAIEAFAEKELSKSPDSLDAVQALLAG